MIRDFGVVSLVALVSLQAMAVSACGLSPTTTAQCGSLPPPTEWFEGCNSEPAYFDAPCGSSISLSWNVRDQRSDSAESYVIDISAGTSADGYTLELRDCSLNEWIELGTTPSGDGDFDFEPMSLSTEFVEGDIVHMRVTTSCTSGAVGTSYTWIEVNLFAEREPLIKDYQWGLLGMGLIIGSLVLYSENIGGKNLKLANEPTYPIFVDWSVSAGRSINSRQVVLDALAESEPQQFRFVLPVVNMKPPSMSAANDEFMIPSKFSWPEWTGFPTGNRKVWSREDMFPSDKAVEGKLIVDEVNEILGPEIWSRGTYPDEVPAHPEMHMKKCFKRWVKIANFLCDEHSFGYQNKYGARFFYDDDRVLGTKIVCGIFERGAGPAVASPPSYTEEDELMSASAQPAPPSYEESK